jgi:sugar-specific transcriptional regulator TrmB
MNGPRVLSLKHCRTRLEAKALLREWYEQIHRDAARQFETDLLADADLDVDDAADVVEAMHQQAVESIELALLEFDRIIDRECGPRVGMPGGPPLIRAKH